MKKITRVLMVALLIIVATISVSAAKVELNLTDAGTKGDYTSGVYYLDVVATDTLYTNVLDLKFTYNTEKIELFCLKTEYGYFPLNEEADAEWYSFADTALVLGTNGKTGLQSATYEKSYVNAVVNGKKCTVQFTTSAPSGKVTKFPNENFKAFSVGLYIPDIGSLTEEDFAIEHMFMDVWNGVMEGEEGYESYQYGYGSWAETVNGQINVVNNVIPKTLTLSVSAGDVVYLQDGTVVKIAETNNAYEIPATAGTVVVNKGYTSQKVYTISGGKITEDTTRANGVLSTSAVSIRNDNVASGIRFKSTFRTSLKSVVAEYGYITTIEAANLALPKDYVLDMALVAEGKAVKDIAYNGEIDIFWDVVDDKTVVTAVITGVPMTEHGVTTKIVTRPYYKMANGVVVYGEPMKKTVYEVALDIKENDAGTYAKYKTYIDSILALRTEKDAILDFSPFFQ